MTIGHVDALRFSPRASPGRIACLESTSSVTFIWKHRAMSFVSLTAARQDARGGDHA